MDCGKYWHSSALPIKDGAYKTVAVLNVPGFAAGGGGRIVLMVAMAMELVLAPRAFSHGGLRSGLALLDAVAAAAAVVVAAAAAEVGVGAGGGGVMLMLLLLLLLLLGDEGGTQSDPKT